MHTTPVLFAVLATVIAMNQVQPADALAAVTVNGQHTNGCVPPKRIPIKRFPRALKARAANDYSCTSSRDFRYQATIIRTFVDGRVMSQPQQYALGVMLGRMLVDSESKMSGSYNAGGGTGRFSCRTLGPSLQEDCHTCLDFATERAISVLRNGVTGAMALNCGELKYSMDGGPIIGCAFLNPEHFGKGEGGGRTGDCCKDSDDCYSTCRSGGECDK